MSSKSSSAGFPVALVLTLIFVTLKLAQIGVVASWSWWWVLSPLWIVALIVVATVVGVFFFYAMKGARKQSRR